MAARAAADRRDAPPTARATPRRPTRSRWRSCSCSRGCRRVERAVFLLHDVFDYGYDEVARIVGKSEDNCRQLAVRARRHVDEQKPRFEASRAAARRLAARFFDAVEDGDLDGLVELLAADVVVYGDGGGTSPSWPRPIVGRDRVAG